MPLMQQRDRRNRHRSEPEIVRTRHEGIVRVTSFGIRFTIHAAVVRVLVQIRVPAAVGVSAGAIVPSLDGVLFVALSSCGTGGKVLHQQAFERH